MNDIQTAEAIELMARFAQRTGLEPPGTPRRYLWTDAFAVTTYLGLGRSTGERRYGELALRLVEQVHEALAPPPCDPIHPTARGLRIGKGLPERRPEEPFNERLEWERDGQYFHYLTKWMHALDQTSRATGDLRYNCWGRELAAVAHRGFVYVTRDGSKRMHWKMSIDLQRPLVASMGQHDPIDGLVTCLQLEASRNGSCSAPSLDPAVADFEEMTDPAHLATDDPLGIGGLLFDAYRLKQLDERRDLLEAVLLAALAGLRHYTRQPDLRAPAEMRLAFRELGLAIGLTAVEYLSVDAEPAMRPLLDELARFIPMRDTILAFWRRPEPQRSETWQGHEDINDVMLAASLAPEGFLVLKEMPNVAVLNPREPSHSA